MPHQLDALAQDFAPAFPLSSVPPAPTLCFVKERIGGMGVALGVGSEGRKGWRASNCAPDLNHCGFDGKT